MEKLINILDELRDSIIDAQDSVTDAMDELINIPIWRKEKPIFGVTQREDCILITATWWESQQIWDYEAYEIKYDDGYWKWLDLDGEEIGHISDIIQADYYMTILKPTK